MRSIRWLAAVTGTLALITGCGGGDGGGVEPNQPPVANFTFAACTAGTACQFTDASTDDKNNITAWAWDFNDPSSGASNTSNAQNPTHTFATAGTYNVSLTVTDGGGEVSTAKISAVTVVAAPPANVPPVANFDLPVDCTAGTPCGFHSTSTDADGTIATSTWDFGDNTPAGTGPDVTHTFAAAGSYNVKLDVTDNAGAPGTVTKPVNVSPAASQDCTTSGRTATCTLTPSARVTVKIRIVSTACELSGNKIEVTAPRQQTAFFNLCNRSPGEEYTITDAAGAPMVIAAGTPITLKFTGGTPGPADPAAGDAGIQIDGTYPNWTLNIDDGGAAGTPGEPDFDDVVLAVQATLAP